MKNILIVGENSYIGTSFTNYITNNFDGYTIDCVSSRDDKWKKISFSNYDVVFDVAGIAHIKITNDMETLFYSINRDMTIKLCEKAKQDHVKQFIFLSSMNVYGDTTEKIISTNQEGPINFYGKSKYEADIAIQQMNTTDFKVVSIRPPVVYGRNCKGNFALLQKLSKYIFVFPNLENKKSVIYIDNLCEFVRQIILDKAEGVFHPQNEEYTSTKEIIKVLRMEKGKKTIFFNGFNWLIKLFSTFSNTVFKVFADDFYDLDFSKYGDNSYMICNFKNSIHKMIDDDS